MKYTIKRGDHAALPSTFKPFVRSVQGHFSLGLMSVYNLNTDDQFDWNKMIGLAFNPLQPDKNSLLIVWRWNVQHQVFEVGPFFNRNFERLTPEKLSGFPILECEVGDIIQFSVDYKSITLQNRNSYKSVSCNNPNVKTTYLSSYIAQPWFGGNMVAPVNVEFELNYW